MEYYNSNQLAKVVKNDDSQILIDLNTAKNYVVKSNDLIQKSKFELSAKEQKIILALIQQIRPTDNELYPVAFKMSNFCNLAGITVGGRNYKHFKDAILILIPVLLGVLCAMLPLLKLFDLAFEGFAFGLVSIFAGFIIGSFPQITKEVKDKPFKKCYIIGLVLTCLFAIGACSVFFGDAINIQGHFDNPEWWFYFVMIPIGMIGAVAFVVPGISGSMTLLVLGFYKPLIGMISSLISFDFSNIGAKIGLLGSFFVGLIIGFVTIARLMGHLLKTHRVGTFYSIIGFIIGSTIVLYFNFEISTYYVEWFEGNVASHWLPIYIELPLGGLLILGMAFLSYFLLKKSNQKSDNESDQINE